MFVLQKITIKMSVVLLMWTLLNQQRFSATIVRVTPRNVREIER